MGGRLTAPSLSLAWPLATIDVEASSLDEGSYPVAPIARLEPQAGEVLVRIAASGVNPLDTKIDAGQARALNVWIGVKGLTPVPPPGRY